MGYAPPLAWDEDSLDDPNATPNPADTDVGSGDDTVDLIAVARASATPGQAATLTAAERRAVVAVMAGPGASDPVIAAHLDVTDRTILRWPSQDRIPAGHRSTGTAPRAPNGGGEGDWNTAEACSITTRAPCCGRLPSTGLHTATRSDLRKSEDGVNQFTCPTAQLPTRAAAERTTTATSILMSHHIDTHGQDAAAIFARTDPWHRLGVTVAGDAFTAQDAVTLGRLGGWDVHKVPLSACEISADAVTSLEVPGYATVRTNPFTGAPEALGVVGAGYRPLQNEEHCDFLNHLADASGAIFDTAGSLRGGRQVFVTMCLPETILIGGVDELDLNIAALNSHDGNSAFRVLLTPVPGGLRQHPGRRAARPRRLGQHPTPPPAPRPRSPPHGTPSG